MIVDTVCRFCSSCCPIEAEVEEGHLVGARRKSFLDPDKRLTCAKLAAAPEIVYSPRRLTVPLIKNGDGSGFREAGWDEALDLIAAQFLRQCARVRLIECADQFRVVPELVFTLLRAEPLPHTLADLAVVGDALRLFSLVFVDERKICPVPCRVAHERNCIGVAYSMRDHSHPRRP